MASGPKQQILLVEDSPSLARVYIEYLHDEHMDVTHVGSGREALSLLSSRAFDGVLLDLRLPDMDGLEILEHMKQHKISTASIVITAHGSVNVAVDAMRAGAIDFLMKPFNADRLKVTLENAIEQQNLRKVVKSLRQEFDRDRYSGFIGASLPMQSIYQIIDNAGPSKATVFITGESGTGKEVCAEAIHEHSPRARRPFVTLNCAAIPKDLMESEIFGHTRGAFTGATSDHEGAAAMADGGTLFLDEICEMDLRLQSKLLRFIQSGTIQKVGGTRPQDVDVRFICATNRNALKAVEEGEFREDLYYRLHVVPIHMPPLRDRGEDVEDIASALLEEFSAEETKKFTGFEPQAIQAILSYAWPGNVRQLQNVLRNVVVLNNAEVLTYEMLPIEVRENQSTREAAHSETGLTQGETAPAAASRSEKLQSASPRPTHSDQSIRPLWMVERDVIEAAIDQCAGNIPRAAAFLEISPSTIYRKLQNWQS
jgi:two-component system repressor protein LuxO